MLYWFIVFYRLYFFIFIYHVHLYYPAYVAAKSKKYYYYLQTGVVVNGRFPLGILLYCGVEAFSTNVC